MANNDDSEDSGSSGGSRDEFERGGISVGDTLKKLLSAGVSAAFMTEEHIRSFVSESKLPKETLNLLLAGASKSKEEITNRVTNEVIKIISKIDFVKEASRFVEEHKFKISAEIDVVKKDKAGEGSVDATEVRTRFSSEAKK